MKRIELTLLAVIISAAPAIGFASWAEAGPAQHLGGVALFREFGGNHIQRVHGCHRQCIAGHRHWGRACRWVGCPGPRGGPPAQRPPRSAR